METHYKTCTKCGRTLPATEEYFYKHPSGKYGFGPICKECKKEYYRINKNKRVSYQQQYYENNGYKPISEQERKRRKLYYQSNKKRIREYYQNNKEKIKKRQQIYYQNNREKVLANVHNYRARLLSADGFYTAHDIMKKYRLQKGKCFYCGRELNYNFHVDHFYPISKGGSNSPSNLVIACAKCNLSKRNMMPEEFIASSVSKTWV